MLVTLALIATLVLLWLIVWIYARAPPELMPKMSLAWREEHMRQRRDRE